MSCDVHGCFMLMALATSRRGSLTKSTGRMNSLLLRDTVHQTAEFQSVDSDASFHSLQSLFSLCQDTRYTKTRSRVAGPEDQNQPDSCFGCSSSTPRGYLSTQPFGLATGRAQSVTLFKGRLAAI